MELFFFARHRCSVLCIITLRNGPEAKIGENEEEKKLKNARLDIVKGDEENTKKNIKMDFRRFCSLECGARVEKVGNRKGAKEMMKNYFFCFVCCMCDATFWFINFAIDWREKKVSKGNLNFFDFSSMFTSIFY